MAMALSRVLSFDLCPRLKALKERHLFLSCGSEIPGDSETHLWNQRRATAIPPELIGRIAPTHIEGINLRGVFRFPVEEYAEQLLPSSLSEKTAPMGAVIGTQTAEKPPVERRTETLCITVGCEYLRCNYR